MLFISRPGFCLIRHQLKLKNFLLQHAKETVYVQQEQNAFKSPSLLEGNVNADIYFYVQNKLYLLKLKLKVVCELRNRATRTAYILKLNLNKSKPTLLTMLHTRFKISTFSQPYFRQKISSSFSQGDKAKQRQGPFSQWL